jgi:hypothetical protein
MQNLLQLEVVAHLEMVAQQFYKQRLRVLSVSEMTGDDDTAANRLRDRHFVTG